MDVILPVAGLGSRLRPQTWSKPKPLVSVAGKPILAHVLDRVMPAKPERLIFITGFLGDQIEAWARANYDLPMEFVEQPEMRGQTDAIIRTRHLCSGSGLILFPDAVFERDFTDAATTDADVIMYTKEVDDPSQLGIAVVEGGRITRLVEKPKDPISKLAVIGIYHFRSMPDLYAAIDEQMRRGIMLKNEYFIADAIQLMIDGGSKVVPANVSAWEDCGNIEVLLSTNRYLMDQLPSSPQRPGAVILEPSIVHPSAVIERSVIGPYASIGANAVVRDSVVRDSIVEDGAVIHDAVLAHSVIGRGAKVDGRAASLNVGDTSQTVL